MLEIHFCHLWGTLSRVGWSSRYKRSEIMGWMQIFAKQHHWRTEQSRRLGGNVATDKQSIDAEI
jgi:hypothetical protein